MSAPFSLPSPRSTVLPGAATAEQLRAYLMDAAPLAGLERRREARSGAAPEAVATGGLLDIRQVAPGIAVLPAPRWSDPELRFLVRPEVAGRLLQAARVLPCDLRLGFWEGLRPLSVQRALWDVGLAYLRASDPHSTGEELEGMLERYVARPSGSAPPHSTGSAVDVAVVDAFGRILNPGDAWGKLGVEILGKALRDAGLANYEPEWWHWSYGDEEWARAFDCAPLSFATAPESSGPGDGI
jgi:D-alanyl-D-alanine dipeptidase